MDFRKNILAFVLVPLVCLLALSSYYRFVVLDDYNVTYEIPCDPQLNSCFMFCEDDECLEPYFYTEINRYAKDLINLCSENILDCKYFSYCTENERLCEINYCSISDGEDCSEIIGENYSQEIFKTRNEDNI
jgi:hypothetical protein